MRNVIGGVARGSDFFDRGAEIAELMHLVERDHLLLLAPRRMGKTSLMRRLQDRPPPGWNVVYTDVESAGTEAEFVSRLLAAAYDAKPPGAKWTFVHDRVGALLQRVGKVGAGPVQVELTAAIASDWQDVGASLFRLLRGLSQPTLVLVDEFPMFVLRLLRSTDASGAARARLLLDWFRSLRLGEGVDSGARFVLAGSIGLDAIVARAGLTSTINDLAPFRLGPLSPPAAAAMLAALCDGEASPLPADTAGRLLARIDHAVPYHLQLLFSEVLRAHRFRGEALDAGLVDRCYDRLLQADHRAHFAHWAERLDVDPPEEAALSRACLDAAARDPDGVDRSTLVQVRRALPIEHPPDLDPLLLGLEHDGYLVRVGPRWRFASTLVRDWWLRWEAA